MKQTLILFLTTLLGGVALADEVIAPPPPKPECHKIVYSKWTDMLFVDNGSERFVSYQWYRDYVAIPGATAQYLYTEGVVMQGDGHIYHVVATMRDGSEMISCENSFEQFPRSADLNPGTVRKAVLYTHTGSKVGEWTSRPSSLSLRGMFIWYLTDSNGDTWTEKVIYP